MSDLRVDPNCFVGEVGIEIIVDPTYATKRSRLAAQGRETQTRAHIGGALNMGAMKEEIVETLIQLLFYAGLPASSTELRIASEVFKERGL